VAGDWSSLVLGLAATPGHGGSLWRHARQEGGAGTLVACSPRAEGQRGGLAAMGSEAWQQCSVCEVLGERR
jgi:hypothetical protein